MIAARKDVITETEVTSASRAAEARHERWEHVHINWTAVVVGALTTFGLIVVFGLAATALRAHVDTADSRIVDIHKIGIWAIVISVAGAFFACAIGAWVTGKVAGILHSEPGMIHGAVAWLVAIPLILFFAAIGAGHLFGGWYGGLGPANNKAPFTRPELGVNPTVEEQTAYRNQLRDYNDQVRQWNDDTPRATRNAALTAVTALLVGLLGAVIGGWLASGEPMNFSHYRTRKPIYHVG